MTVTTRLLDTTMFWNPAGGVRRYVLAKHAWLQRQAGWRCGVATPRASGHLDPGADALAVPSLPLPGSGGAYRLPWRRAGTARRLCEARPSLIESADASLLAWASLDAARAMRIPAVAFCHSNLEQMAALGFGRFGRLAAMRAARRYAARLYAEFELVLAPSRAMQAHLRGWGVDHALHQPLGVDTRIFHPGRRDAGWRASLGLPADAVLLVYVGRFAPEKHLATLADATHRLGTRHWLIAIGAGPAPPCGERVLVLPTLRESAQLARSLASADVFVHAGDQETFGLSALEALACGLPVVARAAQGMAELVDATVGCPVVRPWAEDFADAIADVLDRSAPPLRTAARERALLYEWERVLPALWRRYRRLLPASTERLA